jgi:hypothetical protein
MAQSTSSFPRPRVYEDVLAQFKRKYSGAM